MTQIDAKGARPSDASLRAFVAVANEGSFSAAARSLGVGQPAVSHSIARLEAAVDAPVVLRSRKGTSLTPAGRRLYDRIASAFAEIDDAVKDAAATAGGSEVTLSVSTSFASHWLMPRLGNFKRQHPDIELRLITTDSDRSVGLDDADLWIPLGVVEGPDLVATFMCHEELVPVASPEMAAGLVSDNPSSLQHAPLLHLEERYAPRFDWKRWFASQGVAIEVDLAGDRTNDYSLILQAALDGQGVALGWTHIVLPLIEEGRLVALGTPVRTGEPFAILTRGRRLSEPAARLRAWLVDQF